MQNYTALAPFGGNIIGIEAANWRYFGHKPDELSWAEAALLAVLPNNPSIIHTGRNREKLLTKRNKLLDELAADDLLSTLDLKLAKLELLPEKPKLLPRLTPHLLATLKQQFPKQHRFVSSIDAPLQEHLSSLAADYNKTFEADNIHNIAALVIDNSANKVIAYLGNQTLSESVEYAGSVDIIHRPRSSGSLFKPFLYALSLQKGNILPDTLLDDVPRFFQGYSPENYDRQYRGLVSARQALASSFNIPAVNLLQEYDVASLKNNLPQLGISSLWRPADDN